MPPVSPADPDRRDADLAERLLEAGRSLLVELDVEVVLERLLETARELTGARYAAIGVLDAERRGLERFLTSGVDAATHAAIGDLPRGRGDPRAADRRAAAARARGRRRASALLRLSRPGTRRCARSSACRC